MGLIKDKIGEAAMLEQLAEECCELGQAALKMARIIRKENPTPVPLDEAKENILEEFNDVLMCSAELGLETDVKQMTYKLERFLERTQNG